MVATQQLNGQPIEAVADVLQEEATVGYKPTIPLEALWGTGADMPQITLRRDLEFMQMHPIVFIALEYYKSGVMGAEFWGGPDQENTDNDKGKPISMDKRVAQFVLAHVERFWQRGVPILQEGGYPYGWAPGEHIYKETNGMMVWSHLKGFHPNDGFILTLDHKSIGLRVKNIRDPIAGPEQSGKNSEPVGGTIDLWFASNSIPAKAAWYPHRPRFNQFYGRSQLTGAWRPWRRLGWKDAVEQVIDAAVYRAGYRGPIVRHPMEDMQTAQQGIPATVRDGAGNPRRSARDVARQIVEWAKAGAGFTLSSAQYPAAQGGGPKWDVDFPEHVMDVSPLIKAAEYLEDQIMLGIGVPPELIKAGGTGSGYSGRSIPREAFLDGQQRIADAMLQMFVEQVIKPLVLWNFGDIPFNVQCKSLLKSQADDKQGQQQAGGKPPQQGGQQNQPTQPGQPPAAPPQPPTAQSPTPAAFSLNGVETQQKVLAIIDKVLKREGGSLSVDPEGHEHKGKGPGGGQFTGKGKGGTGTKEKPPTTQPTTKKPKATPEEKKAKKAASDAHFSGLMANKTPEDAKAFMAARADGIAIPPAWTGVVYYGAAGTDKGIIAEGRDEKGRKQRAENPQYRENVSRMNNARISSTLVPRMTQLRQQLRADALAGDEEAKVLYLISLTGFRIGGKGDGKAKVEAFGASSLMGQHVKVNGNMVTFDFPGKKGVRQQHTVVDPVVAKMMSRKVQPGQPVFNTRAEKVRRAWQTKYGGENVHDIRHVIALEASKVELDRRIPPPPASDKDRNKLIKEIATVAAKRLGNNPAEALGTYIDPQLWNQVVVAA